MKKPRLKFLDASSTQTLREGIQELRDAETADSDASESFPPELIADIDIHDAIHVLFGCPASLRGETIANSLRNINEDVGYAPRQRTPRSQDGFVADRAYQASQDVAFGLCRNLWRRFIVLAG